MSGHSKFANIKHKKEKNDAAKGKIFTIIGREIAVAVKEGGPDPSNNFKLAQVIVKAKSNNMPNDTIERGIKKAAGDGNSVNYEFCTYEGYGPSGTAIIVKCLTDNKNRTAANVRNAFTKGHGSIGTQGCVSYMFDEKGQIIIAKEDCEMDADDLMMIALDVIAKAKANNMPNDTIKRGIDRAAGDANSVNYVANTYEGYGPNGTAIIVDTLTDNKNRTAANVRNAFTKGGGNVGTTGCVSYMFDNKGQIIIDKEECDMDADDLMMMALDTGAEDFSEEEDSFEIITTPDDFSAVREALEKEGIKMAEAELTMIPQNYVDLTDPEVVKKFTRILDLLDEDDDVQAVYHNANLPDEE